MIVIVVFSPLTTLKIKFKKNARVRIDVWHRIFRKTCTHTLRAAAFLKAMFLHFQDLSCVVVLVGQEYISCRAFTYLGYLIAVTKLQQEFQSRSRNCS